MAILHHAPSAVPSIFRFVARRKNPSPRRIVAAFAHVGAAIGRIARSIGRRQSGRQQSPSSRVITEETLRRMDWLWFEQLVLELFQHLGFNARKTGEGIRHGVDIELRDPDAAPGRALRAVIQCKTRETSSIGVDQARKLLDIMAERKVSRGILVCNTSFLPEAVEFAKGNPALQLADPQWLCRKIGKVPPSLRDKWERKFLGRDYDVPSCRACGIKLVRRRGKSGDFWECKSRSQGCDVAIPARDGKR